MNCDSDYWHNGLQTFCFLIGHIVWTRRQPFFLCVHACQRSKEYHLVIFFGFTGTGIEYMIYQTQTSTLLTTPPSRFPWPWNLPLCGSKSIGQSIITYGAAVITIVYTDIMLLLFFIMVDSKCETICFIWEAMILKWRYLFCIYYIKMIIV